MSGWAGFSDEELRRIHQKGNRTARFSSFPGPNLSPRSLRCSCPDAGAAFRGRKPPASRTRQQLQREQALQLAGSCSLPPAQQLNKLPVKEESEPAARPGAAAVGKEVQPKPADMQPKEEEAQEVKELEKQEVELREKTRLEQLQQEQKRIEERNKRKKALLTKTIAEKSKQTQAEAVKLKRIQRELQALDDMVSNDIGILRGRIEQASWDYSAARKRYEKAEAEYVTAKLDLHKKTEVKEQLTEHLCAIIQQNELRKAHKLEELMQQLQATEEEQEQEERRRNWPDTQEHTKDEDSVESQDGAVQSAEGCRVPEEKEEEEEEGGVNQEVTSEPLENGKDVGNLR
uniref:RAB6-interacting golgin n=1 Tax=Nothobranchius furzeri TaxID=105023 RepID=A0A8C6VSJ7_NOTFU